MDDKNIADITEKLTTSLDNTQKNSTDIEDMVTQVRAMSESETYNQIINSIIEDDSLDWEQKKTIIKEITDDYDLREGRNTQRVINLQTAKTGNVSEATSWWTDNWWWIAVGAVLLGGIGTPAGRKIISSAFTPVSKLELPA